MQTNDIALDAVESSQIHAVGFDKATNRLAIQFKSKAGPGSIYHYRNFTADDFAAFRAADSLGAHFKQHHVLNTETGAKARVSYSIGNRTDGRDCVTIYAKDYGHELASRTPRGIGYEHRPTHPRSTQSHRRIHRGRSQERATGCRSLHQG